MSPLKRTRASLSEINPPTKDLTRAEALKLAQEKWGATAYVHKTRHPLATLPCTVGSFLVTRVGEHPPADAIYRHGATWREACQRAGLLPDGAK